MRHASHNRAGAQATIYAPNQSTGSSATDSQADDCHALHLVLGLTVRQLGREGMAFEMEDEAKRLRALLDSCHRVLPGVEGRDDHAADTIRKTCEAIEARLRELAVSFDSAFADRTR